MVRPAQEDGMREIFGDFGGGMGAFQAWVASSRHPSQGEGEVSSSRRRRQLVVAGLAASLAGTAFCYYALGSGASSRSLGGAWDAGRESMLQAANRHGVVKASRVSPHGWFAHPCIGARSTPVSTIPPFNRAKGTEFTQVPHQVSTVSLWATSYRIFAHGHCHDIGRHCLHT